MIHERLKGESEQNKKECHRFITIVDVVSLAVGLSVDQRICAYWRILRFTSVQLAVKGVKDEIDVFLDQTRNCVKQVQPNILIELQ